MNALVEALRQHGAIFVFLNVFAEQVGLPMPATPTLIVAGALVARGHLDIAVIAAAMMVGSLSADLTWHAIGRRFGRRVLRRFCQLTVSDDGCVRRTERAYE